MPDLQHVSGANNGTPVPATGALQVTGGGSFTSGVYVGGSMEVYGSIEAGLLKVNGYTIIDGDLSVTGATTLAAATATTPNFGDNSTNVATTAFVQANRISGNALVIDTQDKFNHLVNHTSTEDADATGPLFLSTGAANGLFAYKTIIFDGSFALSTSDNDGIHLPTTVTTILGVNNATITITNMDSTSGAIWYTAIPTGSQYSIRDLAVVANGSTGAETGVFSRCTNLIRCSASTSTIQNGFSACSHLTDCIGTNTINNNFRKCDVLTGCSAICTAPTGNLMGFHTCARLTNCTVRFSGGQTVWGFHTCYSLLNCTSSCTTTGGFSAYGFYDCRKLHSCGGCGNTSTGTGYAFASSSATPGTTYDAGCRGLSFCYSIGTNKTGVYFNCYVELEGSSTPVANTAAGGWNSTATGVQTYIPSFL